MGEPISSRFNYDELLCDTLIAQQYNSSVPATTWGRFYFTRNTYNPTAIKVKEAIIPFVYDVFTTKSSLFYMDSTTGGYQFFLLPPAAYDGPTLASTLQGILNSGLLTGFVVTWNSNSSRFTITGTEPFSLTMGADSPKFVLGMLEGVNASTGNTLVSPNAAIPTGPAYLYLNSDTLGPGIRIDAPDSNTSSSSQIAKIPVTVNPGGFIFYDNSRSNEYFDLEIRGDLDTFDLYLSLGTDIERVPLDMKGVGFSVTLSLLGHRKPGVPRTQRPGPVNFIRS